MKPISRASSHRLRVLLSTFLLVSALGSSSLVAADAKGPATEPQADPKRVFEETKGRTALRSSSGLDVRAVAGQEAGKPLSSLPGVKALSRGSWTEMKEIPKTGLYLVDLDHVPAGLEDDLKSRGYKLSADGALTKNGEPVALFVHGETFRVRAADKKSSVPDDGRGLTQLAERTGDALWWLAGATSSLLASDAEAAQPFPWACFSWYFEWEYHGGFCRDYHARSNAYAWGPGPDGSCGNPKPLTRIEYISTYATVGGNADFDYFYNADQSHSEAVWDIGCFWPAHGPGAGFHYGYWRDGAVWAYRTWSW
jgi:hypothetical protein